MPDASELAGRLRKRAATSLDNNHRTMDSGLSLDVYQRLVGRNQQIREFDTWLKEELDALKQDDDD